MGRVVEIGGSRMGNFLWFQRNPLDFLEKVRELGEVVSLRSSRSRPSYVVNSPDFIRDILATKERSFRKGRSSKILGITLGEGVLTAEGSNHDCQRRMMMPVFHTQKIAGYADTIARYTEGAVHLWEKGTERLISEDMMDLTLKIIMKTMFGTEIGREANVLGDSVDICIDYSARKLMSPIFIHPSLPTPGNIKHRRALHLLNDTVYALIGKAKENSEREDILALLLSVRDEETGKQLADKEIRDQILTILIAGHETTANALSWTWYLLSQHPEVEAKFHTELDAVLGDGLPTFEDIGRLTYTHQIIQESLRLYPPAWTILREANEAVEMGGETFAAHSTMIISPYAAHRNPAFFEKPDEFIPERFAGDSLKTLPRFAYFPFGGGSRSCIGSSFAMMEAAIVLAVIGRRYRLVPADNHHPIEPEPLVSLRIKNGLRMNIRKRNGL
jgi:cytochrome P450